MREAGESAPRVWRRSVAGDGDACELECCNRKESRVENLSYDLLTTLQSKLEGVSIYNRYIQDSQQAGDQGR